MIDDLITRCEAAGADEQRELLEEAWVRLYPTEAEPPAGVDGPVIAFADKLDAKDYLGAALMFLPEGLRCDVHTFEGGRGTCRLWPKTDEPPAWRDVLATPALAVLAAILRVATPHTPGA